ncbi:MAG: hypothetical protein ACOY5F_07165 [Pseudomonadota bacterium]
MSKVISITAVRAERLKQVLAIHAGKRETVIVETAGGHVSAEKIICRERFVEILDVNGDYRVIDYSDIRAVRAAALAQTSVVNARGEFMPTLKLAASSRPAAILPFDRFASSSMTSGRKPQ